MSSTTLMKTTAGFTLCTPDRCSSFHYGVPRVKVAATFSLAAKRSFTVRPFSMVSYQLTYQWAMPPTLCFDSHTDGLSHRPCKWTALRSKFFVFCLDNFILCILNIFITCTRFVPHAHVAAVFLAQAHSFAECMQNQLYAQCKCSKTTYLLLQRNDAVAFVTTAPLQRDAKGKR